MSTSCRKFKARVPPRNISKDVSSIKRKLKLLKMNHQVKILEMNKMYSTVIVRKTKKTGTGENLPTN